MTAACHEPRARAVDLLRWLDQHRTAAGSLPEKVLANGQPASVAPVAWTAAAVVITADELERGCAGGSAG
jgi:glucoamylase